ncbi:MAG: hypothetical protein U5R48_15615 [Gammaproteobacteria bacterium]|nr:hypothetical protein [Gammaproteobacteria bacterium]
MLSDAELSVLLGVLAITRFQPALYMILLTGQRPGEVVAMHTDAVRDGIWRIEDTENADAQTV